MRGAGGNSGLGMEPVGTEPEFACAAAIGLGKDEGERWLGDAWRSSVDNIVSLYDGGTYDYKLSIGITHFHSITVDVPVAHHLSQCSNRYCEQ